VVTNPPLLPFVIWLVCKLRGAKFVLRIDDVYPDMLNVAGMLKTGSFTYRVFEKLNSWVYRGAEQIVVLGRDMRSLVLKKLGNQGHDRVHVIPNWAESDSISPCRREDNPLLQELRLEDKFVVQYAGNMGYSHDIESLVEAAKILSENPRIHFLFIGSGVKREWLEEQIKTYRLTNVTLLDRRPSRAYNIMATGKPIIAMGDETSELALVIQEKKIGWIVPPGEVSVFVNAVLEAESNPERLRAMGRCARLLVEKEYSREHVVGLYKSLFNRMKNWDGGQKLDLKSW
jgi:glycosyltransferase involved in cell wall biosynthesis